MPWRNAAERRTNGKADNLRTTNNRREPIPASTRRLPIRMAANTLAYLIDELTHIAIPQTPNTVAAEVTSGRKSRCPGISLETSLRRIITGFTREIASSDGTAKRTTVARPAAIALNIEAQGHTKITATSK